MLKLLLSQLSATPHIILSLTSLLTILDVFCLFWNHLRVSWGRQCCFSAFPLQIPVIHLLYSFEFCFLLSPLLFSTSSWVLSFQKYIFTVVWG